MTEAPILREPVAPREVIAFPQIDEFYEMLQFRLNMGASDFVFRHPFTVFVNALPRQRTMYIDRYEQVRLIYAGVPRQRKLLCDLVRRSPNAELDQYWNFLDHTDLNSSSAVVSSQLYQAFSSGSYQMADIPLRGMGTLRDYFGAILNPDHQGPPPTERQVAEYHILKEDFNVETDHYVSLPLVVFGEFDGVMHFVYSKKDAGHINERALGALVRSSSALIETQILEWDLVGRNPEKSKAIMNPLRPGFYDQVNRNPILRELGFKEYYRKYLGFYQRRIRFNDDVIHSKVYRPYLKAAIVSIMIDSFAHNVSAHSLVALNWWFKRRAENLRLGLTRHRGEVQETQDIIEEFIPEGFDQDRLLELLQPWFKGLFVRDADPKYDLVNFPGSLAREVQPLLKFLMQKGAFWSGISRDHTFGGESASAFDILWTDFLNNPLYLGTIAKSEAIHKLRIRVVVYEPSDVQLATAKEPVSNQPIVDGVLVEVNLKNKRPDIVTYPNGKRGYPYKEDDCFCLDTFPELEEMSDFVWPGDDYPTVKAALEECRLFLPGEVVGRHAFFTLLENKIRNVKHFKGAALQQLQDEGLELCISFQEKPVRGNSLEDRPLYEVGVWLSAPTPMYQKDGRTLIGRMDADLRADIMDTESFAPRLGGSSQDKLCAGMLFNNYFLHVQNGDFNELRDRQNDSPRDQAYYPWIISACSPLDDVHTNVGVDAIANVDTAQYTEGYLKKFFHLWKASDIHEVTSLTDTDFDWENLARFRFIALNKSDKKLYQKLFNTIRQSGVLRVVPAAGQREMQGEMAILEAYANWLPIWMSNNGDFRLRLLIDHAVVGQYDFKAGPSARLSYTPAWELDQLPPQQAVPFTQDLYLAHGGQSDNHTLLRYRNHGVYIKYFQSALTPNQSLDVKAQARMAELFEVLTTRICIFDSRVYYRLGNSERRDTLAEQLLLHIFDEQDNSQNSTSWLAHWERHRDWILAKSHFLVLHLSFVEKIILTKYGDHPDYSDENIGLFIQEEIFPHIKNEDGQVRENFVLVITTGRGRTKWWTQLANLEKYQAYQPFTNFRPVESIVSAIEDAVNRKDDLELKYNLVKVMFGS